MYSISENLKTARFLPHKIENRIAAVKMLRNSPRGSIHKICKNTISLELLFGVGINYMTVLKNL